MEQAVALSAESPPAASPLPSAGSGSALGAAPGSVAVNRMLIYKANVTMEVENYADAYTEVQNAIHLSGGYLVEFSEQTSSGAERSARFTIKVPADGFHGFLERLEKMEHLFLERSMQAQDVSEEYVDLEARLRAKQVVEEQYLKYMGNAERSEDLIRFTNELAVVQEEIERIKGRMRYLEQNVAYSTIELRLYERSAALANRIDEGLGQRMAEAVRTSLNVLTAVVEGLLILLAGVIPIALAALIVGGPVYWWIRKRKPKSSKIDI